jgi:Cell division protein FtsI/penicillin-binding protein 2
MLYRFEDYYYASDGDHLTLSLDSAIPSYCASILNKGVEHFEVQDGGFCLAVDPLTGELLAWAEFL